MDAAASEPGVYVFEPFRLDAVRRIVTRGGAKVELTPRLFEILFYLIRHHERVVSRDELQHEVWGGRTMEGTNLAVAISSLRKALQDDEREDGLVATVPGQGYQLKAAVTFEAPTYGARVFEPADASMAVDEAAREPRRAWRRIGTGAALLVIALIVSGLAVWRIAGVNKPPTSEVAANFAPPPHSVAVMAFKNLSGDPAQDYFSDGISDELINALCQIGTLHVVAPSSSFSFKRKSASIQDIARQLNVGTVVVGSVRRGGNRLFIEAEIRDGITGGLVWSQTYDRDENQILQIQEELARAVATDLQDTLHGVDAAELMVGGASNAKALDLYLRAIALRSADNGSEAAFNQEVALLGQAIALDPTFAIAKADLSITIWHYVTGSGGKDLANLQHLRARARDIAEETVARAPNSALGHEALGYSLGVTLPDFTAQEAEFARARALAPGSSRIVGEYARFAIWAGNTAAGVAAAEQATALNPLSARASYELGWNLFLARRPNEAMAAVRHAQELGKVPASAVKEISGYVALERGDPAAAQVACTGLDTFSGHQCLAVADHALGKTAEASAMLAKMHDEVGDSGVFNYAEVAAQWGQTDAALTWLETAYRLNDPALLTLRTSFWLDPIRQTPRYKAIDAKLNFPP